MATVGFIVACLLTVSQAVNPLFRDMVVHESTTIPGGFVENGAASSSEVLKLRVALTQNNIKGLESELYAVSDPASPRYGQHLSKGEVEAFVRPSQDTVNIVNQWLADNNLEATTISPAGDWISFQIPVGQAEGLLNANFSTFTHLKTGDTAIRTLSYSIPTVLKGHVDLVHPTITFPNPFARLPATTSPRTKRTVQNQVNLVDPTCRGVPSSCQGSLTPACLQKFYNIPTTPAVSNTSIGISGFLEQFANSADLETFLSRFRPDIPSSTTFTLQTLDGGTNSQLPSQASAGANLDIQYTIGLATGVPTSFISVGPNVQDGALGGLLDIINFLLAESNPPHVLLTSFGQDENTISSALAVQLCNAYAQLGARGTSIIFLSGLGGVAGFDGIECSTFLPAFPSGCPFVTSVGTTTEMIETAADISSGGFSNVFAQPSYQASAVSSYLTAIGNTDAGLFNRTGRGYPDVSAQGENVQVVVGGATTTTNNFLHTSSSPTFASIIALLNDRLVAAGRSPLGFLNPFLYSAAGQAAFNDITTGENSGCNTAGFFAKAGWDPLTGIGTPNFVKLLAAIGL